MLLHDIAKGRPEDHSIAGAASRGASARIWACRPTDTETVAWLVEHHLLMSMTAQTRDLNDRKTIDDFAAVVQSVERLKLLLVLTVCDIRGVGPGRLERLEGPAAAHALLRDRAAADRRLLRSVASRSAPPRPATGLREALAGLAAKRQRARYVDLHYDNYLLAVDLDDQLRHAASSARPTRPRKKLATMVKTHEFEAVTEITVLAPDHPRLLSVIAGACAAAGGNIVDAQIFTTTDGRALDTILISREFDRDEDERRRAERVGRLIEDVLSGKSWLPEMIEKRAKPKRGAKAFRIEPRADIRNALSNRFSVIEVSGPRPAGPAVGDHRRAVRPLARHRLGPHHHLRREGDRHLLRHRPHRPEDREPGPARRHPQPADRDAAKACRRACRRTRPCARPNEVRTDDDRRRPVAESGRLRVRSLPAGRLPVRKAARR